jgi:hypothetical protein
VVVDGPASLKEDDVPRAKGLFRGSTGWRAIADITGKRGALLMAAERAGPRKQGTPVRGLGDPASGLMRRYKVLITGIHQPPDRIAWEFDLDTAAVAQAVVPLVESIEVSVSQTHGDFSSCQLDTPLHPGHLTHPPICTVTHLGRISECLSWQPSSICRASCLPPSRRVGVTTSRKSLMGGHTAEA